MSTAIQWTDVTDNIIVAEQGGWWCRRVSPGCDNCYACTLNQSSYFHGNKLDYSGKPPKLTLRREVIAGWPRQAKAKRHFVASMTDVFGEWVPEEWTMLMLSAMALSPRQTFQVLTKRASVMATRVLAWLAATKRERVPSNIWLGFSAEDQHWYDLRATHSAKLRGVCDVLWVSAEPLLGMIDLEKKPAGFVPDWIVGGGESGKGARVCPELWLMALVADCERLGIPCFVKQVGQVTAKANGYRHKKGGDMEEWPEDLRVREFPDFKTQRRGDAEVAEV